MLWLIDRYREQAHSYMFCAVFKIRA
jgi:hypothetical protein